MFVLSLIFLFISFVCAGSSLYFLIIMNLPLDAAVLLGQAGFWVYVANLVTVPADV